MTAQTAITQKNHRRAVRFFWGLLIGATWSASSAMWCTPCCRTYHWSSSRSVLPPCLHRPARCRARHRSRRPGGSIRQGLLLGGGRRGSHRRRRIHRQFPDTARSDAGYWIQLRNGMDLPRNHRHGSCRQHHDAGCAGGQTGPPHPHRDPSASTQNPAMQPLRRRRRRVQKPRSYRLHRPERRHKRCKRPGRTLHRYNSTRHKPCRLNASRSDTGRRRPCVRADCIRCDYTAHRYGDRGALGTPQRRVDQRCRQSVGDQPPDCAAHRGGCRRALAGTARSGFLSAPDAPTRSSIRTR